MEMQGDNGFGNYSICNGDIQEFGGDKFMQYSADQIMVLEQFFMECQNPSHDARIAMIRENSVLSNFNSQQIQAWFENRSCVEKKILNEKMAAMGRVLLLENDFFHGEVQQLLRQKEYICELLQYASLESFLALEVPRSVFKNVKAVATRRLLLLQNEYLHNEVQEMHREREYIRNLQENQLNSESVVNSCRSWSAPARSSQGYSSELMNLPLLFGTIAKLPPKTSSELNCVSIPRMKFSGGHKEISLITCSDLTNFPVNVDVPDVLSFVKAAMIPHGPLDFMRKHQEFVICCSLKDVTLVLQGSQESPTAVVPAFLPQNFRVVVGRYCVSGAWSYFPNEQAASGNVQFVLRFNCVN